MRRLPRPVVRWLVLFGHLLATRLLASRDPIATATSGAPGTTVVLVGTTLLLRAWLFVGVPVHGAVVLASVALSAATRRRRGGDEDVRSSGAIP